MNRTYFKIIVLGILILRFTNCKAQSEKNSHPKINSENYYEFYQSGVTVYTKTNWLQRREAVPIIIEEVEKLGLITKQYVLYELESEDKILLDVYIPEKKFGIVFNTGNHTSINKKNRNTKTYYQNKYKNSGSLGEQKVYENLPDNIIVLQENWYWYQIQIRENDNVVNKKTVEKILREDVRKKVANIMKN